MEPKTAEEFFRVDRVARWIQDAVAQHPTARDELKYVVHLRFLETRNWHQPMRTFLVSSCLWACFDLLNPHVHFR